METAAIIVAAGRGERAGSGDVPKQYRLLAGVPVLTRALESFAADSRIEAIVTVISGRDRGLYDSATKAFAGRLMPPMTGGATRQESVRAGLECLAAEAPRNVLIHDAARPFADADLIGRVIDGLAHSGGAVPGLAVADTLKRSDGKHITETVDRSHLWAAQTPQGFRYEKIMAAHRAAAGAGRTNFTDDSALAEWHGMDVALVDGAPSNVKLTTGEDFLLAEDRFAAAREFRTGQGFDVHAFGDGDHVTLCGVKVPHDRGLTGHSDADAGLHALTDALLGAIGDGDIGAHFPPGDPQWRGAPSDRFLRDAGARVAAIGASIVNVDVTLICEAPKIDPHRDEMRACIAEIIGIEVARVSVKATTTEGLGFTGRGEGIAAQAMATVRIG